MNTVKIKVGDKVRYYCYTACTYKVGTVEALNVRVMWRPGTLIGLAVNGVTREYRDVVKITP